jgi:glutaredoxin
LSGAKPIEPQRRGTVKAGRIAGFQLESSAAGPVAMSAKVVLYSKPGCHLCDDAHAVLDEVRRELPFELDVRDISKSRKLIEAYGLDIPVVTIDGAEVFRHRLTADQLRAALGARTGSRPE